MMRLLSLVVTVIVEDSFRNVNVILLAILRFLVIVGIYIRNMPITPRNKVFFLEAGDFSVGQEIPDLWSPKAQIIESISAHHWSR
jgi:hypothetical protein